MHRKNEAYCTPVLQSKQQCKLDVDVLLTTRLLSERILAYLLVDVYEIADFVAIGNSDLTIPDYKDL